MEASRGEIRGVDLNPVKGHEQGGQRPALIISVDGLNHGPAELVILIPLTTRDKGIPHHIEVLPPEGGLTQRSFIKCEDIRSVSKQRLAQRLGRISDETLQRVEEALSMLLFS
jgi:mRNA interferase MazF